MTKSSETKRVKEPVRRELYEATAERDGRFWLVRVPALRGVRAQVRRLEEAEEAIRGAIALWFEVEPDEIEVTVKPVLGDVDLLIDQTLEARIRAEEFSALAADLTQQAAKTLIDGGLTVRDAGDILGISHQRIAQLISEGASEVIYEARPAARTVRVETRHGTWLMTKTSGEFHPDGDRVHRVAASKTRSVTKGR